MTERPTEREQEAVFSIRDIQELRAEVESLKGRLEMIDLNTRTLRNWDHEQVTAGTATLQFGAYVCEKGIIVKGDDDNTDKCYIGKENVAATGPRSQGGFEIGAGQAIMIPIRMLADLFYMSPTAAQLLHVWMM